MSTSPLIERDGQLTLLGGLLDEARSGWGRIVFVGGEAGAGKTSLVRAFCTELPGGVRLLWGACDPLSTPRPLGPFHDMALKEESVARVLERADRHERMTGLLGELSLQTVMVLDDAHWADEATLDVLRFLGRRISGTPSLVVTTYRDDELGPDHPLRAVLGQLATADGCRRLDVGALSPAGVARLAAEHDLDPVELHRVTAGNPFFVTEALAAGADEVPQTVADAVIVRAGTLSPGAREALEIVSLSPGGLEPAVVTALLPESTPLLDECVAHGMLIPADDRLAFRHELARLAVDRATSEGTRRERHASLLTSLELVSPLDSARLAHHADAAGDGAAVLRHAPQAAEQAAARGAHREAAEQYGRAVAHARARQPLGRADLFAHWAEERAHFDDPAEVALVSQAEVELRRLAGDTRGEAVALERLGWDFWRCGEVTEFGRTLEVAAQRFEQLGSRADLARAAVNRSRVHQVANRLDEGLRWGLKAMALADAADTPVFRAALLGVGYFELVSGSEESGLARFERALMLPLDLPDPRPATRLAFCLPLTNARRYDVAIEHLAAAIAFADERDQDLDVAHAEMFLAQIAFEQGRWGEAVSHGERALERGRTLAIVPARVGLVLARMQLRRGEDAVATLAAAVAAAPSGLKPLEWRVVSTRAEAAWWAGRLDDIPPLVDPSFREFLGAHHRWAAGELAYWLWRAGALHEAPDGLAEPFALQISGDWRGAADAWDAIGCPYERADALADGDEPAMREALAIFTRLGARPAADRVRARMRDAGVTHVPTRPRASTRAAPAGLTRRQLEVLTLLGDGRSNADIARELYITEKTAEHHVSAVLRKLGVSTRGEAAAAARKIGVEGS